MGRGTKTGEHYLYLPGKKIRRCRRGAFIRDVHHVDAGHRLEKLAGKMRRTAGAGRCIRQLAGIVFSD